MKDQAQIIKTQYPPEGNLFERLFFAAFNSVCGIAFLFMGLELYSRQHFNNSNINSVAIILGCLFPIAMGFTALRIAYITIVGAWGMLIYPEKQKIIEWRTRWYFLKSYKTHSFNDFQEIEVRRLRRSGFPVSSNRYSVVLVNNKDLNANSLSKVDICGERAEAIELAATIASLINAPVNIKEK